MTDLVAADPLSQRIVDLARRVAATDATVLLIGPSGAGKEVFARFIHQHSARHDGPFVAVNCAAIPENMLEAMLFGYEKGAFTGAVSSHAGKFEQAQSGTLLLDEISEMDLGLQAKLLRVLQEREVERLGSRRTERLDVRVLATSNRDLKQSVMSGDFREDLFYRLNVFPIAVPPLAERRGDIIPLAEHFLSRDVSVLHPTRVLSQAAAEKLMAYDWPGNVRELDNVLQRALILRQSEEITAADIHFELWSAPAGSEIDDQTATDEQGSNGLNNVVRERECRAIADALRTGKSRKEAAEILGISPRTLRYKIARLREQDFQLG
ncbi:sigma-54-dependent Fis family transcriptional regulator [Spongiibacter nanhainus]|uniref:Sigma-54-dependent Fis family transcriptional regulator n=1 Tax=Spongiibacter nanhainus TaxID=2794344 RepID=A0A7T4R3S5_9GAMM|nr:sigma-54 dependent transcriptional regulator [Spongiibacter nanhainus]QQD19729.1 sigma-54-dependent Fis family transcriptional regulator [Spongiibacter nanhainus]